MGLHDPLNYLQPTIHSPALPRCAPSSSITHRFVTKLEKNQHSINQWEASTRLVQTNKNSSFTHQISQADPQWRITNNIFVWNPFSQQGTFILFEHLDRNTPFTRRKCTRVWTHERIRLASTAKSEPSEDIAGKSRKVLQKIQLSINTSLMLLKTSWGHYHLLWWQFYMADVWYYRLM